MVRYFSAKGYNVIALGRQNDPPAALKKYARWIHGDICKKLPKINADIVIHAAGLASDQGTLESYIRHNVNGTKNVWDASQGCKTFIYISSASVYGQKSTPIIEEDASRSNCSSPYGVSKLCAEELLQNSYTGDTNLIILRPRAIYGSNDRVLLPRILDLIKGKRLIIPDQMKVEVSMTHISNLILAVEACIQSSTSIGVYNVTDDRSYILEDVVRELCSSWTKKDPILISTKFLRKVADLTRCMGIPSRLNTQSINYISQPFVLNIDRIKNECNYDPKTNFYDSLLHIIEWVHTVGYAEVKKGNKDLPWIKVN